MQSCPSNGAAPHMPVFGQWNILFEIQTALIIEADTPFDFERLSAVDIG